MDGITILLIACSLAMDAFAVSIANGVSKPCFAKKDSIRQGIYFGCFQFLMLWLGWLLGSSVKSYMETIDHWIAFGLLVLIGGNMILESLKKDKEEMEQCKELTAMELTLQAIATSIDALAVGISFAILDINILMACCVIGIVAFLFSYIGGMAGSHLGQFLEKKAAFAGGVILCAIGIKILMEHLYM